MYYKLTNSELNNKLNKLCDMDKSEEYCETDYNKV